MISIVIPVYNQSKKLDQCLASLQRQSYTNYEIIVVNDRSTEKLSELMAKWRQRLGVKIEFLHNQSNHGAPYSRNKGARQAKGEFLFFCDADLLLKPDCLAVMVDALRRHPAAAYAYCSHIYGRKTFRGCPFDPERLKQGPCIHTSSLIRRVDFPAAGFDENLRRLQDWDLWLTMLEQGKSGVFIDKILFRVQAGGTISTWRPKIFYKLFPFLPSARKYQAALDLVREKHGLNAV